jgi:hypothetical protein
MVVGFGQLQAHDQSFQASHTEKEKSGQQIKNADPFVIHRGDPAEKTLSRFFRVKDFTESGLAAVSFIGATPGNPSSCRPGRRSVLNSASE